MRDMVVGSGTPSEMMKEVVRYAVAADRRRIAKNLLNYAEHLSKNKPVAADFGIADEDAAMVIIAIMHFAQSAAEAIVNDPPMDVAFVALPAPPMSEKGES